MKEIGFDEGPVTVAKLLPNLRVLGPRLGAKVNAVRAALQAGDYEDFPRGGMRAAGIELGPDDVIRWIKDEVLAIALDTDASAIEPIIVRA